MTTLLKLYHASPELFSWPRLTDVVTDEHKPPNGALGLWTATENASYLSGFGHHLYELSMSTKTVYEGLPLRTLARWNNEGWNSKQYVEKRFQLRVEGIGALRLLEKDGQCLQMIIIDVGCIAQCTRLA